MQQSWAFRFVGLVLVSMGPAALALEPPPAIVAEGHDQRIDIVWQRVNDQNETRYAVYRAEKDTGPWERLTAEPYRLTVYSDWVGKNGVAYAYRVTTVAGDDESQPTEIVSAKTRAMNDEELLESVQKGTFRYNWDFAHPVSGLTLEGLQHKPDTCTIGGTGFGLVNIMIGADRGWITREEAAEHLLKMIRFLDEKAERYKGVWSHWLNGRTGKTIAFSGKEDNGGDLVETAFLVEGMLTIAAYFDADNPVEQELRERIDRMWREVEWDWYQRTPDNRRVYWHWSPQYHWEKNAPVGGHFNECLITYILGMASPTHPLPKDAYDVGWLGKEPTKYPNGKEYYGMKLPVGYDYVGPLFFTHYSFIGLDPRALTDRYTNYFENNRITTLINRAHCIANPKHFKGYSDKCWGLTASFDPWGYRAHNPGDDNGTITPTAALSSFPYAPKESMAALKHFYYERGKEIWGPLGFWDAFNPGEDWVSDTFLAIDQGPIVGMIENYRTQLPWRMFMQQADILRTLRETGLLASGYKPVPRLTER